MTREEAAGEAVYDKAFHHGLSGTESESIAEAALAAADAHDAANGVHRVSMDDATVKKAIGEVSHHITPVIGWMVHAAAKGKGPDQYHDALTTRIEAAARAVLAAAVKEGQ